MLARRRVRARWVVGAILYVVSGVVACVWWVVLSEAEDEGLAFLVIKPAASMGSNQSLI